MILLKYFLMYTIFSYIIACADDVNDSGNDHSKKQRILRIIFWPLTVTSFFRSQNIRLHRLLNILWCVLIAGWLLSLMADKL